MPRRKSRSMKVAIGDTSSTGLPSDGTTYSKKGVNRGGSPGVSPAYIGQRATSYDGSVLTTFPTFEPLFTSRPKVIQVPFTAISVATVANAVTGGNGPAIQNQMATVFQNTFDIMLDNIAMKYANAQNLGLSTPVDWQNYIQQWMTAASIYAMLVSLLNGDGFNEVTTRIAQAGVISRSRIQTGLDRLQSVPVPPGLWSIILRSIGYFASYEGGDCYLGYPSLGGNPALDFTNSANWAGPISAAETALTFLQGSTANEAGVIRIVASEYYGVPAPVPYPGVRVCKSLYDQFRLIGMRSIGATNVFAEPAIIQGAFTTATGQLVPLLIPKGSENDPWWTSLYRAHPFEFINNDVKVNAGCLGLFCDDPSQASTWTSYPQGNQAINTFILADTGLNGFSTALDENYWAPLAAGATAGLGVDNRTQNDFSSFAVSDVQLAANTMALMLGIYVEKKSIGYPPDCKDISAMKVRPRL